MNLKLVSTVSSKLSKKQIKAICQLKDSQLKWRYGIKSQIRWFKKNNKKTDIHNMFLINSKLIGYTSLRLRNCIYKKKRKKYILFDTLILIKEFRGRKFSKFIMGLNNSIINHSGLFSFLICDKQLVKFYKKFGWKLINKKFFSIIDRESLKFGKTKFGMTYNYNLSVNNKFIFYSKK